MASNTFHSLRFEDGDVLVKLSSDPNDWLLLHKDTITEAIPQLAGMFRFAGGPTPMNVSDPASGVQCSFYTLSIKHVDNTLILSDEKDVGSTDWTKYDAFRQSELSEGWPNFDDEKRWLWKSRPTHHHSRVAIVAHQALFCIIYGLSFSLNAFREGDDSYRKIFYTQSDFNYGRIRGAVTMLSVVGAYAEYYGCLSRVAPVLLDMLIAHPCIWQAVNEHPYEFLRLANKLRCAELYLDALRHLLSRAQRDNFKTVSAIYDQSVEESKAWIKPMMDENAAGERNLERALNMLHLSKGFTIKSRVITFVPTTYLNMIDFKRNYSTKKHSEEALSIERSRLLAGNIFSQWWQQQLAGK